MKHKDNALKALNAISEAESLGLEDFNYDYTGLVASAFKDKENPPVYEIEQDQAEFIKSNLRSSNIDDQLRFITEYLTNIDPDTKQRKIKTEDYEAFANTLNQLNASKYHFSHTTTPTGGAMIAPQKKVTSYQKTHTQDSKRIPMYYRGYSDGTYDMLPFNNETKKLVYIYLKNNEEGIPTLVSPYVK